MAKRFRRYLPELFTFVRDPLLPPTNNEAERPLRPLVVVRKISGGTRSPVGSRTRMVLHSVLATAQRREQEPLALFRQFLLAPPGSAPGI